MNAIPERDVFKDPTHIIVWGTSKTWWKQTELLLEQGDTNVISTGSRKTTYNFWAWVNTLITDTTTWLPLKDQETISWAFSGKPSSLKTTYKPWIWTNQHKTQWKVESKEFTPADFGIADVSADVLTHWKDIDLTLHAMNMSGMSHEYPEEVVTALEDSNAKIASLLYISYEANSHVFYPVRDTKSNMENSALRACEDAKIVDLITFDSPSAKALGFTFLGIVWDFVNFLEDNPENQISKKFSRLMHDFLWEDYNWIIELFAQYPIRWELYEGQESMKEMAWEWTLNSMISWAAKKINFAKISRISWVITDLYLLLAMNDLNQNRSDILNTSWDRVLLDWNRISQQDTTTIDKKIDNFFNDLVDVTLPMNTIEWRSNGIYIETKLEEDSRNYELNVEHLDFLSNHFWILPFFLLHDMVKESGLLWEDECIISWDPNSMVYSYNKIRMQKTVSRKGKPIIELVNSENPQEVFCVFETGKKEDITKPEWALKYFNIPKAERNKSIDESSFPHSVEWGKKFLNYIPFDFEGINFSQSSALIEHLWFQLANLLLNNPNKEYYSDIKWLFPRMEKFNKDKLAGKFWRIITEYESPSLDEVLATGITPEVNIVAANYKEPGWMGNLNITLESFDWNGELIGRHRFMLA